MSSFSLRFVALTVGFAVGEVDGLDEGWEVQEEEQR